MIRRPGARSTAAVGTEVAFVVAAVGAILELATEGASPARVVAAIAFPLAALLWLPAARRRLRSERDGHASTVLGGRRGDLAEFPLRY